MQLAKEAVSNILKHSDGDFVQIRLREHPEFQAVDFSDFVPEVWKTAATRGSTSITVCPGAGFTIRAASIELVSCGV